MIDHPTTTDTTNGDTTVNTVPHRITNAVTGESHFIYLKPKGDMTAEEAQAFLAGRVEEGERIDPDTCQIARWPVEAVDIYGIFEPPGEWSCFGKETFVRNLPDGDWVWEGDLPNDIAKALYDRIEREADTYENYVKRPKETLEVWQAKHDLWRLLGNYSFFLRRASTNTAEDVRELHEKLRKWQEQHPDLVRHQTGDQGIGAMFELVNSMLQIIQTLKENGHGRD
jgi:polyhydroxyalkanoate synthesis regulator phasin